MDDGTEDVERRFAINKEKAKKGSGGWVASGQASAVARRFPCVEVFPDMYSVAHHSAGRRPGTCSRQWSGEGTGADVRNMDRIRGGGGKATGGGLKRREGLEARNARNARGAKRLVGRQRFGKPDGSWTRQLDNWTSGHQRTGRCGVASRRLAALHRTSG
jgi:hypothetical protein